jgi:hypothetical protein
MKIAGIVYCQKRSGTTKQCTLDCIDLILRIKVCPERVVLTAQRVQMKGIQNKQTYGIISNMNDQPTY